MCSLCLSATHHGQFVFERHLEVLWTVSGRRMHQPGAFGDGHVVGRQQRQRRSPVSPHHRRPVQPLTQLAACRSRQRTRNVTSGNVTDIYYMRLVKDDCARQLPLIQTNFLGR